MTCSLFLTVAAAFHEVSVYPKKELPFFILFTAGLCSFTAMLAMLTHQFPELMGVFAKAVSTSIARLSFISKVYFFKITDADSDSRFLTIAQV